MIGSGSRYFCLGGHISCGGPTTWEVNDWDRRRVISVSMDGEHEDDVPFLKHYSHHSDQITPGIYRIHVSPAGDLISTHSEPEDDRTYFVHYPFLADITLSKGIETARRNELEELDRFGP